MPFFQQFTGINAVIFYSPVLFSTLGSGDSAALESTLIVGAVNVVATVVAIGLVDRVGEPPRTCLPTPLRAWNGTPRLSVAKRRKEKRFLQVISQRPASQFLRRSDVVSYMYTRGVHASSIAGCVRAHAPV